VGRIHEAPPACFQPEAQVHTVSVGKVQSWLGGSAKRPNEQVLKSRLREMLRLSHRFRRS
jgi:hypothetical protein